MGKTKKVKKEKKVKLTAGEIKLTEKYNSFINLLKSILEISNSFGMFYLDFNESKSNEQKIVEKINKLKEDFAREDEGTKLEAENKRNLMEVIQMITRDEGRLLEIKNTQELELAKLKHANCD